MKITHEEIRTEIEAWAMKDGQQAVAIRISENAFQMGVSDVLQPIYTADGGADEKAIYNNRQQIFRWIRSDHRNAVERISELWPAIEKALPAERRARLTGSNLPYLVSVANRVCTEAVNAAILHDTELEKKSD